MALLLRAAHRDRTLEETYLTTPLSSLLPPEVVQLSSAFIYRALTSLAGRQTLGEEAAGLIPVHKERGTRRLTVPSTQRLALLVLLGVFGRRVLEKVLRPQTLDLLERLHHVVFLVWPKYLQVSHRLSQVSHVVRSGGLGTISVALPVLASVNFILFVLGRRLRDEAWESFHCQSHALSANQDQDVASAAAAASAAVPDDNDDEREVKKGSRGKTSCPLCISPSPTTPLAATIPCGHIACWDCLQRWVNVEGGCPVCREPTPGLVPLLNLS